MTGGPTAGRRWAVLALLVGVLVAGLTVSAAVVFGNGDASGDESRLSSVFDPPADLAQDREKVLAAAREFVVRFNSYGPALVKDDCKMPEYAAVGDLMTAKFRTIFANNVVIAESTVTQTGIDRVASVDGIGISAIDTDSATVLASSTVEQSYPDDKVQLEPQSFRYQISLVYHQGAWLVDDLDDVDDGLASFGTSQDSPQLPPRGCQSATPSESPSGSASDAPSDAATTPSSSPSDQATTEGSTAP
ncbi:MULTISPECIES: hypothetical protein [unclassified Nocardioides]|uniref:hypothetical protein n=1 Tax=unclassified Nocardioides TaxID=2615069 RepID=UPI0007030365|nr:MULTISPECIES: hypothetical protein [unclassified Nocardioides]KRC52697.1 hypothetical protein ASE19_09705 [Nocardioides sp. Root79]KRC72229.1 hypothetical protein ASE20_06240 [Nocardioides sp. Root240]